MIIVIVIITQPRRFVDMIGRILAWKSRGIVRCPGRMLQENQSTRSKTISCLFIAFSALSGALPIMVISVSMLKFCIIAHMG